MQWHRNDALAVLEYSVSRGAQQAAERLRERSSAFVLERVDDFSQRAFISAGGDAITDVTGSPRLRARNRNHTPTEVADAAQARAVERLFARNARGRERCRDQCV